MFDTSGRRRRLTESSCEPKVSSVSENDPRHAEKAEGVEGLEFAWNGRDETCGVVFQRPASEDLDPPFVCRSNTSESEIGEEKSLCERRKDAPGLKSDGIVGLAQSSMHTLAEITAGEGGRTSGGGKEDTGGAAAEDDEEDEDEDDDEEEVCFGGESMMDISAKTGSEESERFLLPLNGIMEEELRGVILGVVLGDALGDVRGDVRGDALGVDFGVVFGVEPGVVWGVSRGVIQGEMLYESG